MALRQRWPGGPYPQQGGDCPSPEVLALTQSLYHGGAVLPPWALLGWLLPAPPRWPSGNPRPRPECSLPVTPLHRLQAQCHYFYACLGDPRLESVGLGWRGDGGKACKGALKEKVAPGFLALMLKRKKRPWETSDGAPRGNVSLPSQDPAAVQYLFQQL